VPAVPQIALQSCRQLDTPIATVPLMAGGSTGAPQVTAVLTGIAIRTAAFVVGDRTIMFISDDSSVFMNFAFLS